MHISVICHRFSRSNYESLNKVTKEKMEKLNERVCVMKNKIKRCSWNCVTWETVRERKRKRVRCEGDETKKGTERATKSGWSPDTRAKTKILFWTKFAPTLLWSYFLALWIRIYRIVVRDQRVQGLIDWDWWEDFIMGLLVDFFFLCLWCLHFLFFNYEK